MIDWLALIVVALASLLGAALVVSLFALGIRLMSTAGSPPIGGPVEFTDAITVISPKEAKKIEKRARKAAERSPLSPGQKRLARAGAYACFALTGVAVLVGIYLIVPTFH